MALAWSACHHQCGPARRSWGPATQPCIPEHLSRMLAGRLVLFKVGLHEHQMGAQTPGDEARHGAAHSEAPRDCRGGGGGGLWVGGAPGGTQRPRGVLVQPGGALTVVCGADHAHAAHCKRLLLQGGVVQLFASCRRRPPGIWSEARDKPSWGVSNTYHHHGRGHGRPRRDHGRMLTASPPPPPAQQAAALWLAPAKKASMSTHIQVRVRSRFSSKAVSL